MLPGPLQHIGQTAISAGENSLQIAGLDIMPVVGNGAVPPEGIPQQVYDAEGGNLSEIVRNYTWFDSDEVTEDAAIMLRMGYELI